MSITNPIKELTGEKNHYAVCIFPRTEKGIKGFKMGKLSISQATKLVETAYHHFHSIKKEYGKLSDETKIGHVHKQVNNIYLFMEVISSKNNIKELVQQIYNHILLPDWLASSGKNEKEVLAENVFSIIISKADWMGLRTINNKDENEYVFGKFKRKV